MVPFQRQRVVSFRAFQLHMSTNPRAIRWRSWYDERVLAQGKIYLAMKLPCFYPERIRYPLQQQYINVRSQLNYLAEGLLDEEQQQDEAFKRQLILEESRLRLQLLERMHEIVSDEPIDWQPYVEQQLPYRYDEEGPSYKMAVVIRDTYIPTLYDRLYGVTERRLAMLASWPERGRESDVRRLTMYEDSVAEAKAILARDYERWPAILSNLIPFYELELLDTTVNVDFTLPLTAQITIGEGAVPKTKIVVDEVGELREEEIEHYDELCKTFVGNMIVRVARNLARIYPVPEVVVVVDDCTVTIDTESLRKVDWSTTTSWAFIEQQRSS